MQKKPSSIFFVSLPKSGTVYTWTTISKLTHLNIPEFHLLEGWSQYNSGSDFSCPKLYACGDYNTQLLLPHNMQYYSEGYIFGAHMQASFHNMHVLEESGYDRIVVLLRDPRDALVSWVHHLKNLGPSSRNYHSKIYHIPCDYWEWSLADQFHYQIRSFLPTITNWVEGWLAYYADPNRKMDILFVLYDELKRQPLNYFKKIMKFYQIHQVDYTQIPEVAQGQLHYRKGEHEQWREEFSPQDQSLVADLMQDRIKKGFNCAALHHHSIAIYNRAIQKQSYHEAAVAALSALQQFPNSDHGYQLFFSALTHMGIDTTSLQDDVTRHLRSLAIEDYFKLPDRLLRACADLLSTSATSTSVCADTYEALS